MFKRAISSRLNVALRSGLAHSNLHVHLFISNEVSPYLYNVPLQERMQFWQRKDLQSARPHIMHAFDAYLPARKIAIEIAESPPFLNMRISAQHVGQSASKSCTTVSGRNAPLSTCCSHARGRGGSSNQLRMAGITLE